MTNKLIFLSHIHEEQALAFLIKEALEHEFAGFVDVFVSSDGTSIPAGSNFLKRIENGLVDCVGAIYLISPTSVARNWVNFELGAVWVRSAVNVRAGLPEIPTLPICHSGMTPSALPAPLNNLNAVTGNDASKLEFAFRSIQAAVGGRGPLKTDFDAISRKVIQLEHEYTLGANLLKMFKLIGGDRGELVKKCESILYPAPWIQLLLGLIDTSIVKELKRLEANELKGHFRLEATRPSLVFTDNGAINGADVSIFINPALIMRFRASLSS